jgi:LmbE family N-acetylglucosaminyl deacetylase
MNKKKLKIIAVGAHLDDLELACGGTLAKAIRFGHEVRMVVLSRSGYKHYSGKYERSNEEAMKEGKKAAQILGIRDIQIYDYPAKDIPNDSSVVESLNEEFDSFKPDLIFTHWEFDTHRSHANSALATFAAARYFNSIMMYEPFPPGGRSYMTFRPQFYIDITDFIDVKLKALGTHRSELKKYGPEWINTIRARAALRGFEMINNNIRRVRYAESFEVLRLDLEIF